MKNKVNMKTRLLLNIMTVLFLIGLPLAACSSSASSTVTSHNNPTPTFGQASGAAPSPTIDQASRATPSPIPTIDQATPSPTIGQASRATPSPIIHQATPSPSPTIDQAQATPSPTIDQATPTPTPPSFPSIQGTYSGSYQYSTASSSNPITLDITQQNQQVFGGTCTLGSNNFPIQNGIVDTSGNIQFSIAATDSNSNNVTVTFIGTAQSGRGWQGSFSDTGGGQGMWSVS